MYFQRFFFSIIFLFIIQNLLAQTKITGTIIDNDSGLGLANVNILDDSKNVIFFTDNFGNFELILPKEKGILTFKKDNYFVLKVSFKHSTDFGIIKLTPEPIQLNEVELNSTSINYIKKTAFSQQLSISKLAINTLQGEITNGFKPLPSVYVSSQGGGMGDGKIIVRGFEPAQNQIFINGIQINDMESGWVYWSNWSGLIDTTNELNFFSGIYNENVSTTSFGGTLALNTINQTKKTYSEFKTSFGSGLRIKNSILHHVADKQNNASYTFYFDRNTSKGVVNGTPFVSNTYYFDFTKILKNHQFSGFILGAPQWHGQRSAYEYHMATLGEYLKYGLEYNYNYGKLNNKALNWTENYFHKNLMQFLWNWQPDSNASLSANVYSSFGTGGGSYETGSTPEFITPSDHRWRDTENGTVMWDKIINYNQGLNVLLSDGNFYQRNDQNSTFQYINTPFNAGLTKIAFTNKHHWFGGKLKIKNDFNENLTSDLEYHFRYTHADNFDRLADLLGSDGFMVYYDQNNFGKVYTKTYPLNILSAWNLLQKPSHFDKLHFHYQSNISLHALTGKTVLNVDNLSVFSQYNIQIQKNQRIDFFNYLSNNPKRVSEKINQLGYSGLLGTKYIFDKHSFALISGFIVKPNRFEQLFVNYKNDLNTNLKRENTFSTELNYQFKPKNGIISFNIYFTDWKNKYASIPYRNHETNKEGTAYLNDVHQMHLGMESVYSQRWKSNFETQIALSVGNWVYKDNARGNAYDNTQNYIGSVELMLDDIKVGNSAQMKAYFSLIYKIKGQWELNLQKQYFGNLYSNLNMNQNLNSVLKLPDYFITDFYVKSKPFFINKVNLQLEFAVENLLNKKYIIESATNISDSINTDDWNGINMENKVFFGPKRNWNFGINLHF